MALIQDLDGLAVRQSIMPWCLWNYLFWLSKFICCPNVDINCPSGQYLAGASRDAALLDLEAAEMAVTTGETLRRLPESGPTWSYSHVLVDLELKIRHVMRYCKKSSHLNVISVTTRDPSRVLLK